MFQNKTVNLIVSIVIAIGLWAYVIITDNPTVTKKFDNIAIEVLNEESLVARGLTVLDDEIPTVTVTVEGKRADVTKLTADEIVATVDVYGYTLGENSIPVNVEVPSKVTVTDIKSSRIKIVIDELVSISHSLEVVSETAIPEGTELRVEETMPEEVMLTGAKSIVSEVRKVEAVIDASLLGEETASVRGSLIAVDALGEPIKGISLSSDVVEMTGRLLSVKEVKLELDITGEVSGQYAVSDIRVPGTVKIVGKAKEIKDIETVKAKSIDISSITSTNKLPIEAELPEGVYLSAESQEACVYVVINDVIIENLYAPTDSVEFRGLAEGCKAELVDDIGTVFHIVAKGPEDVMLGAEVPDFSLIADLTGLSEGEHTVPLIAEYTKKFIGVEVEPTLIKVRILGDAQ